MNIVVAEDDKMCAELIERALGGLNRLPITHVSRLADLWPCLTSDVDIVWLDLFLEDCSAEGVVARLPEIRALVPNAALIVVSGWGEKHRQTALLSGADAYSSKQDLDGFSQEAVRGIVTKGAVEAMKRGVSPSLILERAAKMLREVAHHSDAIPNPD